jgi:hypothetical protein
MSNKASDKLSFVDIIHVYQSVICARSQVWLCCSGIRTKLNLINWEEMIFEFIHQLNLIWATSLVGSWWKLLLRALRYLAFIIFSQLV